MKKLPVLAMILCLIIISGFVLQQGMADPLKKSDQSATSPRQTISLDGSGWRIWLDENAEWENDSLFAPGEFNLSDLPVNPPTCGWKNLQTLGRPCETPVCIEQLYANGDPGFFYHGVSWIYRDIQVPSDWKGKIIHLDIARARVRVEIYLNRKLAGYDLCCETPVEFDLSRYLEFGKSNHLAIRLTNPGGSRGFDDAFQIHWGRYTLPSGRDFSGLDNVSLTVTNPVFVSDVFVMNQLPAKARNVLVKVSVENTTSENIRGNLKVKIEDEQKDLPVNLKKGINTLEIPLSVPRAKLWDIDSPNLYICAVTLRVNGKVTDQHLVTFGFRVFEVKKNADGKNCFYLNGRRFRHRSAIDWGFFAHTGLFATKEMAERTVSAVKKIGHNGINLHRHIGEYRVLNEADKQGVTIYEEPGGFHQYQGSDPIEEGTLADKLIQEKIRRMVLRDRNHPSLIIHNLSNEDNYWGPIRKKAMLTIHRLNPAVMVCNASGHSARMKDLPGRVPYDHAQPSGYVKHIRPYEDSIRNDYQDDHTVGSTAFFEEFVFDSHLKDPEDDLFYFGEVFCHTGPANWWLVSEQKKESPAGSYDELSYKSNHDKIEKAFTEWNLSDIGSRIIRNPADVTLQAGRGLMYTNGRLSQRIMSNNAADGYAINGWSAHSYRSNRDDNWDSAILDEGRNIKGPAEDYKYWVRPLQVAIFRKNGKYFTCGDTARFEICIINEGILSAGNYVLKLTASDGSGNQTSFYRDIPVNLKGGDQYAENVRFIDVELKDDWHAGYITITGQLMDPGGKEVASGKEQILLSNRKSFEKDLKDIPIAVFGWPAAKTALSSANANLASPQNARILIAGKITDDTPMLLKSAYDGKVLMIKFDSLWADYLYKQNVLSTPVIEWGGDQSPRRRGWFANGWGYLDHFIGDQAVPSATVIGTNSWEVPGEPFGFYPFESKYRKAAYGLYFARPDINRQNPTLLVLLGTLDYGKGKIILMPTYPVDENSPLNDLLFFNTIVKSAENEW